MPTLEDALDLARGGWQVFPLRGKAPATRHGFHEATRDEATITAWWQGGARNIGGNHPGIVTIDCDPRNGGTIDRLEALAGRELPGTLVTVSGRRDGGVHLHYRHPGVKVTERRIKDHGFNVKDTNLGYVVLPPSIHPDTGHPYEWIHAPVVDLPKELLNLLLPKVEAPRKRPVTAPSRSSKLPSWVARLEEGNRNSGLFWAACQAARDGLLDALEHELLDAALTAGLSEREAAQTIASARRTAA